MRIHEAGYPLLTKMLALLVAVNAAIYFLDLPGTACLVAMGVTGVLYLFLLNFFRSPARVVDVNAGVVLAPADGRVVVVEETFEGEYLNRACLQVSIFMNIFNVHANWFPVNGIVTRVKHHPGRHAAAYLPKSSKDNERSTIAIRLPSGEEIVMRQIAGALARRVVIYAGEGEEARQDKHAGFIKFGSRVDLFLPTDTKVHVSVGQKVVASRTIIGTLQNP